MAAAARKVYVVLRSEAEAERAINLYADTVKRICMLYLKNYADTEDIFQTVFMKYVLSSFDFESPEHEKAWIIRVTINQCKDLLKSFFHNKIVGLEEILPDDSQLDTEQFELLQVVFSLPPKYKDVIYLHYYEGYTAAEIGKILKKPTNTIYTYLARARELLKKMLGDDWNG